MTVETCPKPLLNKRFLVVEDALDNRQLYSYLLEEWGALVEVAEHGEAALSLINKMDFDLVLMDLNMPVMDGYETMRLLSYYRNRPPTIALTAYEANSQEVKLQQCGFDAYLAKPIDPQQLYEKIISFLEQDYCDC